MTTAKLGKSGQDYYHMTIRFGMRALHNYQNNLSLTYCIPGENNQRWYVVNVEERTIEIRLK